MYYCRRDSNLTGVKERDTNGIESISSDDYISQVDVGGGTYVFEAVYDPLHGNKNWRLEFYEQKSRRLVGVEDKKVINALVKLAQEWIKTKEPHGFYTIGSVSKESYNEITDALKKGVKGYTVIDEREDIKEDNDLVREGNPVGRIMFSKGEPFAGGFEPEKEETDVNKNFEQVEDVKTPKFKVSDKVDKKETGYETPKREGADV